MACECFQKYGDMLKERLTQKHADDIGKVDEAGYENSLLILNSGDHSPVAMNYRFRFFGKRKNGELARNRTIRDSLVIMNYCPYCGTKFEGSTTDKK